MILDYMVRNGLGWTNKNFYYQLPNVVPGEYWHKNKTDSESWTKHVHYFYPIIDVKLAPDYPTDYIFFFQIV